MICFVIAMDKEAQPILTHMVKAKSEIVFGRKVCTGKLFGKKAAVITCGVGKVNAAAGTQLAISLFKPDCIINLGVAGGLNERCTVGNIYCVSKAVQYDFDLCQLNDTPIGTLDEYKENFLALNTTTKFPLRKLATADRFNDSRADNKLITKELGADLRDMEGAAIVHVCKRAQVPVFAFKAVSDVAGSGSTTEQYLQNLKICTDNIHKNAEAILLAARV